MGWMLQKLLLRRPEIAADIYIRYYRRIRRFRVNGGSTSIYLLVIPWDACDDLIPPHPVGCIDIHRLCAGAMVARKKTLGMLGGGGREAQHIVEYNEQR